MIAVALAAGAALAGASGASAALAAPPGDPRPELSSDAEFVPGEVVVRARGGGERVRTLPPGVRPAEAIAELSDRPEVAYASRNWIATAAIDPLDRGSSGEIRGWRRDQWNFLGRPGGVRVGAAWSRVPSGGGGVTVAVVDTGIAYATASDQGPGFTISPGFAPETFGPGYDFVDPGTWPLDENGHGTHIAGTIAEAVTLGEEVPKGERDYLTGLAFGATLLPVRVLDGAGMGTSSDVAAGIRWAARNGADVINVSLQLPNNVRRCEQVPGICRAIRGARKQGALVVGAAGNTVGGGRNRIAFPAAAPGVLAVGASTRGGCLAGYSHHGKRLDLLAPGGGRARGRVARPRCKRDRSPIRQVSLACFPNRCKKFHSFEIRSVQGTSMAAAHASGVAALVRASGVLGANPKPNRVRKRLRCSARRLKRPRFHGSGLLDAARATKPRAPRRCRR